MEEDISKAKQPGENSETPGTLRPSASSKKKNKKQKKRSPSISPNNELGVFSSDAGMLAAYQFSSIA
jgi:hypothetical protein